MQEQNSNNQEKLILDSKKHLSLTCVESVDGFNEQFLKLSINGVKVQILGEKIKITAFNKASGHLDAQGDIYQIKYLTKKQPIVKRIFK